MTKFVDRFRDGEDWMEMGEKLIDTQAPDFALKDVNGKQVRLSDFRSIKNVVLVFNRGLF